MQSIIDIFAEKPSVQQKASGQRGAVEQWGEGGLGVLRPLV